MDAPSPLSILLLVSSPHEAAVSVRDDLHALHAAVDDLPYAAEFVTCVAESDALLRVLNRYDRPPFRLLHFIGHGAPDGDASALLAFEGRLGELRLLDGEALAPVLAPAGRPEFELAVLSACHSERVADALVGLGVGAITVAARDPGKAARLVELGSALGVHATFADLAGAGLPEAVEGADVLVSTVPADAAAEYAATFAPIPVVLDAIYDPWPTPLARAVADAGGEVISGLQMLLHQAFSQVEQFTGRPAPRQQMAAALN